MANLVYKNSHFRLVFRTIVLKVKDDRRCFKSAPPTRAVLLPRRLSYQIDGKRDFNEVPPPPWCHVMVHFEVKMSQSLLCPKLFLNQLGTSNNWF